MIGRPTKYDPKYCKQVVDHMAKGYSFESFAGKIGVSKQTIYDWLAAHPDFLDAKETGFEASRLFWEGVGIQQAKHGEGNATAFVFNMKNRFPQEWRDKHEVDNNVTQRTVIIDTTGGTDNPVHPEASGS